MGWRQRTAAFGVALAVAGAAAAAEPASVVIIFDGSGSMWGNLEGARVSKLVLAREALRRALGGIDARTRVGVAAFGHRRGDCGDVEVLRPPEPLNLARILEPLDRLNPKGRGPLTLALREAAKVLPPGPAKRSLILIHDDADNCQPDVCAAAAELRAADIVVQEIGLALKADDAAKMACLPRLTNGRFFAAADANGLATGIEQALQQASGEAAEPAAGQPLAAPLAGQAVLPDGAPPGLYARAVLAEGGAVLSTPLDWTVSVDGDGNQVLFAGRTASPVVPVAPGRYRVEARAGAVSAHTTVEARAEVATPVALALNAGLLRVNARLGKAGAPLEDALITVVGASETGAAAGDAASGALFAAFKGSEALVLLPAGRFLVRVDDGLMHAQRAIVVPAGSQGRLDIALDAARLQVSTSGRDGSSPLETPTFSVEEDDPDAPRGRREVARSAMRQADFVLPAGTYYVVARQGGVEVRERLALAPGESARRSLAVASGRLALAIRAPGLEARGEPVAYRVERSDGIPAEAIATSRPAPLLLLAPGRYRVEGRYGAANARSVKEVEVKAGQTQQLTLEPAAAAIKLRLTPRPGGGEVFWELREDGGKTVWTSAQAEATAVLQAGRYRVRAELRERTIERTVELRPGEARVLELAD